MGKNGKGDEDGWNKQWELYTRTLAPRYKHASKGSSKMVVWLSMPSSTKRPWPPKGDGCRVSWGAKWPPLAWVKNGIVCDGKGSCQDVFCWKKSYIASGGHVFLCRFRFVFSFVFLGGSGGGGDVFNEIWNGTVLNVAPRTTAAAPRPYAATRHHGSHGGWVSQRKQHRQRRKTISIIISRFFGVRIILCRKCVQQN